MKNHLLGTLPIFILFFIFSNTQKANAQSEFGVKGGTIYSGQKANYNQNNIYTKKFSGFELGAFYKKHNFWGSLGFQAELLYQLKGMNFYSSNSDPYQSTFGGYGYSPYGYSYGGYEYSSYSNPFSGYGLPSTPTSYYKLSGKYHNFTVPLLLSYSPLKFIDLYAGPQIAYTFAASTNGTRRKYHNPLSIGYVAGAAVKLGENTKLDFRYSSSFKNSNNQHSRNFSIGIQQTLFRKQ